MKLAEFPEYLREAVATFEALRRIGFSPNEIFLLLANERDHVCDVFIAVRAQGKEFNISCGKTTLTPDEMTSAWSEMVALLTSGSEEILEEMLQIYRNSYVYENADLLCLRLMERGFVPPRALN